MCNKWHHRTCLNITKKKYQEMIKLGHVFYCRKKCINLVMPFAYINEKEYSNLNTPVPKFPCIKCTFECHKNTNCIRCHECMRWSHLECTNLKHKQFENTEAYFCSKKCEVKALPFTETHDKDFNKIYTHENYYLKHGYKQAAETQPKLKFSSRILNKDGKLKETKTSVETSCDIINPNHVPCILNLNDAQNLTIFHGNVASLNKNLDSMGELFQNCDILPNIIGVTETKLKLNSDSIEIGGYIFEDCRTTTEAGGAGLYISEDINYKVREDLSIQIDQCEDKWIEVTTKSSKSSQIETQIVVGIVYRHPRGSIKRLRDKICKNIDYMNNNGIQFVIMGDLNVNLLKYNIAGTVTDYLNNIQGAGCLSFINKPTRVCRRGTRWESSCVDHLYSNIDPENVSTYVIESAISDHFSCLTKIRGLHVKKTAKVHIYKRKSRLGEDEIIKFNSDLKKAFHGNSAYINQVSVHNKADYIVKTYQNLIDKYMPKKKLSRKETSFFLKPWLNTKGIRTSIKTRNILLGRSKRLKCENVVREYKIYDSILTKVKKRSFNNHIGTEISNNFENKQKLWKTISKVSNRRKSKKTEIKQLVLDGGKKITEAQEIANNLNNHFNKIGQKMAKNLKQTESYSPLKHITKSPSQSICMYPTTYGEIRKIINHINAKKASGPDEISGYIMKVTLNTIVPVLAELFNMCLSAGIFPDCLKTAEIVPIHKGGKRDITTNYRPISLLPQIGKIFEKIIASRMTSFIDKHKLLVQNQYGFRKHYSTELAVTEVHNKLLQNFEEKKHTCAIFLDLAKAFDSVDHGILLNKLEKLGIRGLGLSLLKSYLTGRLHYVKTNDAVSEMKVLNIGVPQGSVLGPLLFLIFINDLPNATKFSVTLFADDTFLSLESSDINKLQIEANAELEKVRKWLLANKLTLNIIKSKFMLLTNRRNVCKENFLLKLDGSCLERCSSYKYLGVFFDDKLNWKTHIKYLSEKIGKVCGFLSKLRHCADVKILKMVYSAVVKSHLQYCITAWGNASETILKPLMAMQNRIIRILTFAPFLCRNVQQYYDVLEVMNLKQIYKFEKGKFMFRLVNNKLPSNFENLWSPANEHNHNLRSSNSGNIREQFARTIYGRERIQSGGAKLWNEIPTQIQLCESLNIFINKYRNYVMGVQDVGQQRTVNQLL